MNIGDIGKALSKEYSLGVARVLHSRISKIEKKQLDVDAMNMLSAWHGEKLVLYRNGETIDVYRYKGEVIAYGIPYRYRIVGEDRIVETVVVEV